MCQWRGSGTGEYPTGIQATFFEENTVTSDLTMTILPRDPYLYSLMGDVIPQATLMVAGLREKGEAIQASLETGSPAQSLSVLELASRQEDVVDWDGPQDPQNPRNWTAPRRWSIVILVSAVTFN